MKGSETRREGLQQAEAEKSLCVKVKKSLIPPVYVQMDENFSDDSLGGQI